VPTFKELGYPDLTRYHWRGLLVKKGTPPEIIQELHDGFKKAMEDQEWKDYMESSGMLDGYLPPDEFKEAVYAQAENDLKVLKEMGLLK
jgi:tripartite-type tricarboxylate transporter receptor subunit TctC